MEKEESDREDDDDDSDGDDSDDSVGDDRATALFLQAVRQDRDVSVSESVGRVAGGDRAVGRVDQDGVETAVAVPGVASQVQHLELVPGEKGVGQGGEGVVGEVHPGEVGTGSAERGGVEGGEVEVGGDLDTLQVEITGERVGLYLP